MPDERLVARRARPLLGTLVTMQVQVQRDRQGAAQAAIDAAFDEVALVHRLMSAHEAGSDLARLAQAREGQRLSLHPHTRAVLRLAQHWCRASGRAFDAQAAGEALARHGLRPALEAAPRAVSSRKPSAGRQEPGARFLQLDLSGDGDITSPGPLRLDLGGLAKGYAVDEAVRVLRERGMPSGLVNAGGDLRAFGDACWPVEVQHPGVRVRTRRLMRLREGAIATSLRDGPDSEFITTRRRAAHWQQATVFARDCASADALTKWALQASAPSLQLRATLARLGGRLWRQ